MSAKILIIVNSLQAGGAERAAIRTARGLSSDGYHVVLGTLNNKRDFYQIPRGVERINLGDPFQKFLHLKYPLDRIPIIGTLDFAFRQLRHIRKMVKNEAPDIVLAFESLIGSIFSVGLWNTGIPLIVSERVNPDPNIYKPHVIALKLRPLIYKLGAICTVQTSGFSKFTKRHWKIDSFITPNHVFEEDIVENSNLKQKRFNLKRVIAVGRLVDQKDYHTLLRSWKLIENANIKAKLDIFGAGDEEQIRFWINEMKLKNVSLHKPSNKIKEEMLDSTLLVSTSKFEGFPNVVLEALSCGIPVVSTISSDIVETMSKQGGLLSSEIGDHESIALQASLLLTDYLKYEEFASKTITTARYFLWENVRNDWFAVISYALKSNGVRFPNVKFFKKI